MILIEHNGQRMLVHSLKGHEGCKVIQQNASEPSVVDDAARLNGMTNAELVEEIMRRLSAPRIG